MDKNFIDYLREEKYRWVRLGVVFLICAAAITVGYFFFFEWQTFFSRAEQINYFSLLVTLAVCEIVLELGWSFFYGYKKFLFQSRYKTGTMLNSQILKKYNIGFAGKKKYDFLYIGKKNSALSNSFVCAFYILLIFSMTSVALLNYVFKMPDAFLSVACVVLVYYNIYCHGHYSNKEDFNRFIASHYKFPSDPQIYNILKFYKVKFHGKSEFTVLAYLFFIVGSMTVMFLEAFGVITWWMALASCILIYSSSFSLRYLLIKLRYEPGRL